MDVNLFLGAATIAATGFGIWGLVFYRKHNGNGPPVSQAIERDLWQVDKLAEVLQPLATLPNRLEQTFQRLAEAQAKEQTARIDEHLEYIRDQMSEPVPSPWPPELVPLVERLVERLEQPLPPSQMTRAVEAAQLADAVRPLTVVLHDVLDQAERFEGLLATPREETDTLRSVLAELPIRLGEILAAERSRAPKAPADAGSTKGPSATGGGEAEGGGGGAPPRRPPRALPALSPGTVPVTPQIPAAYVGGSVYVPAGEVYSLLALIQQQLSPNCPGTSVEFAVEADPGGDPVLVGGASQLGGPLTEDNYAYQLTPASPRREYRSSYPGNNTPIGELQVLAPGGGYLHVEVQT